MTSAACELHLACLIGHAGTAPLALSTECYNLKMEAWPATPMSKPAALLGLGP